MKSRSIDSLHVGTTVVLVVYLLLLLFMALIIPNGATMWANKAWASEEIQAAQTPEELRQMLQFAASSISAGQQTWAMCLFIFMFATIGMIGFLGWSLFLIRRLKRE